MPPPVSPLNQLKKLFDKFPPQVVIVVGTGIAINATKRKDADWKGLLKNGVEFLVKNELLPPKAAADRLDKIEAAFNPFRLGDALAAAEDVEHNLKYPNEKVFESWLKSYFADFKASDDLKAKATLEALRELHEAGALVLTTNYDNLLSDITDAPPVTWEDRHDFNLIMQGRKTGILHIHGHWKKSSSIVLGSTSYNRVKADTDIQQLLQTLWLTRSWIYVGCGDGLDDPNLGRLLEWSKRWEKSALDNFFLSREDIAKEIELRSGKPQNIVGIGFPSFDDLPTVLESITPTARCGPFLRVDVDDPGKHFSLFHLPGASDPFPTRQEYLSGDVPTLAADAELESRLQAHGWVCCIDVASVGKTTLALRAATTAEQRTHPVFYLDLKREIPDDADLSPMAAIHRLARPGTLLILDNIHYQPELAHEIWQFWNAKPPDGRGRILLVGTQIDKIAVSSPEQDLMFFKNHPANPAILLKPTPEDLGRIAAHLYRRIGGSKFPPMQKPPTEALVEWHRIYGAQLNAFTFAVLSSLAEFQKGQWLLPPARASAWVRQHWLRNLDPAELENVICLAVFGAQELEMLVQNEALPHPGKIEKLFELGLVTQTQRGQLKQYRQFELREPGWGHLILAALEQPADADQILFATASKHLQSAIMLSARLKRAKDQPRLEALWKHLTNDADEIVKQALGVPLPHFPNLVLLAEMGNQPNFVARFWKAIEADPLAFAARAWATSLEKVGSFLEVAKQHGRDTAPLWKAIESQPDKLVASAWATSLNDIGSLFNVASRQNHDASLFTQILANDPDHLAGRGTVARLEELVGFSHHAPASLLEPVLRDVKPGHWKAFPDSKGMVGATWLAWECGNVKRNDLANDLILLLLRRANWRDFAPQANGFTQACWLLANVPSSEAKLAETFRKAVCTDKWLQIGYAATSCGQLASGLRELALHQPPQRCEQFFHKGLGGRLNKELARFENVEPSEQSQIIQFLGSAQLCGRAVSRQSLSHVTANLISQLPLHVLPHKPEATKVQNHQFQLWLGLRAFLSTTRGNLPLPTAVIQETLKLWRANVAETASLPKSVAHRVNLSMVAWLESCLRASPPALIPTKEPLWVLAGFPARLNLPKRRTF